MGKAKYKVSSLAKYKIHLSGGLCEINVKVKKVHSNFRNLKKTGYTVVATMNSENCGAFLDDTNYVISVLESSLF